GTSFVGDGVAAVSASVFFFVIFLVAFRVAAFGARVLAGPRLSLLSARTADEPFEAGETRGEIERGAATRRLARAGFTKVAASNMRPDFAAALSSRSRIASLPGSPSSAPCQSLQLRRNLHAQ